MQESIGLKLVILSIENICLFICRFAKTVEKSWYLIPFCERIAFTRQSLF